MANLYKSNLNLWRKRSLLAIALYWKSPRSFIHPFPIYMDFCISNFGEHSKESVKNTFVYVGEDFPIKSNLQPGQICWQCGAFYSAGPQNTTMISQVLSECSQCFKKEKQHIFYPSFLYDMYYFVFVNLSVSQLETLIYDALYLARFGVYNELKV